MADKTISEIQFSGRTGTLKAYLTRRKKEKAPGIVLIHDIFGLADHTKDVSGRLCDNGYAVLAPDLYSGDPRLRNVLTRPNLDAVKEFMHSLPMHRLRNMDFVNSKLKDSPKNIQESFSLMFSGLPKKDLTDDLVKAVGYLRSLPLIIGKKVASIGFCFGGGMSIRLGCRGSTDATVIFYGENPEPLDSVKNIKGPVLGMYGGDDERITMKTDLLVKSMAEHKKDFEMRIYKGAGHAFFNDTNKAAYRRDSATEAWGQLLNFLDRSID